MVLTLGGPGFDRSSSRGWGKARAGLPRVTAACKLRVFLTAARNSSAAVVTVGRIDPSINFWPKYQTVPGFERDFSLRIPEVLVSIIGTEY